MLIFPSNWPPDISPETDTEIFIPFTSTLNEKLKAQETEKKSLEEQLQSKDGEIAKANLNAARVDIRHEFGISKDLEKFLVGDTEEDIRSNAELLKKSGSGAAIEIQKKTENGPAESATKTAATQLFGPKSE